MDRLKLIAMDEDDLKVISSCCQDAVLKVGDMEYHPAEKQFVLALNRFAWEREEEKERRKSFLHFERVESVKLQGVNRDEKDTVLSVLAVLFESKDEPAGTIELVLAGDGAIRLDVECIEAQLLDLPAAWKASSIPSHE